MIKNFIAASISVLFLASFSPLFAQKSSKTNTPENSKPELKFLDDIEVSASSPVEELPVRNNISKIAGFKNLFTTKFEFPKNAPFSGSVEEASSLQLKYSLLLDTEVEAVQNVGLFNAIDQWYGTPYLYGGTTKRGIDCSAFVQAIYAGIIGFALPRTAREQYKITKAISRTELKEGDLVFFNTMGGVSHVGIYLQNNKFVHSASTYGVTISDLYDAYWEKRFISAGRLETASAMTLALPHP